MEYHKGGKPAEGEPILPDIGEMVLPKIEISEIASIFLGTIDAAKERAAKETLRRVFVVLDEVTFTCGKIEMTTERLKKLLEEAVK